MTRQEHMHWCKKRAHEYVKIGDGQQAITSMLSDLSKHSETESSLRIGTMLMMATNANDMAAVRRFIDGFN